MEAKLTELEAFEAMRVFLAQFNEREPPEQRVTLELLLGWSDWSGSKGSVSTADPAQWDDWLQAVESARGATIDREGRP